MGIIKRQSIKNSIVNSFGVLVGGISILFIYPLSDEIYGYAQFLYSTALLLVPLLSVGALTLVIKFFPEFSDSEKNDNGFLSLMLLVLSGLFLFTTGIAYLLKEHFYRLLSHFNFSNLDLVKDNEFWLILLSFVLALVMLFYTYSSNFGRIVVPDILKNLGYKVFLPILVLVFYYQNISTDQFAGSILVFFCLVLIGLVVYLAMINRLKFNVDFSFLTKNRVKRMSSFMAFSALNNLGGMLAFRIDAIMISIMLSTASTGLYFKILFIANVIDIPALAIHKISAPIIARAWTENDTDEIRMIYKKSSVNLLIAGLLVFLLCWFSMDHLFAISVDPDSFENGKMIFFFLALGKLFNMLTSVNNPIISYSILYKYNIIFIAVLSVANLILNYYFIGSYNVVGAALATCISIMLFNLIKFLFILIKFKMHPLTYSTLYIFIIFSITFGLFIAIPTVSNDLLQIGIYLTTIPIVYGLLVYKFKISEDLNILIDHGIQTTTNYLNK